MKTIEVYQSCSDNFISLEWIGTVKYIGRSFGVDGLTDNSIYDVVKDKQGNLKVVDDSGEDYLYDLNNPRPVDATSAYGKFYIVEDPNDILQDYICSKRQKEIA